MTKKTAISWHTNDCVINAGTTWATITFPDGHIVRWRGEEEVRALHNALMTVSHRETEPPFSLPAGRASICFDQNYRIQFTGTDGAAHTRDITYHQPLLDLRNWLDYCFNGNKQELSCHRLHAHARIFHTGRAILAMSHHEAAELSRELLVLVNDSSRINLRFCSQQGCEMNLSEWGSTSIAAGIKIDRRESSPMITRARLAIMALEIERALTQGN